MRSLALLCAVAAASCHTGSSHTVADSSLMNAEIQTEAGRAETFAGSRRRRRRPGMRVGLWLLRRDFFGNRAYLA